MARSAPTEPAHGHHGHDGHRQPPARGDDRSLTRVAIQATLHCLVGCAIGEVTGMVLATAIGLNNSGSVLMATALAFVFGYALTAWPLLRNGMTPRAALRTALAADTVSIAIMEVADNALLIAVPGAMDAGLGRPLFWASLAASLAIAAIAAVPVNRWLIARGRGHAVVHAHH